MFDFQGKDSGNGKFVCPSDRQLALRAKLHSGWCTGKPAGTLRPEEQAAIISVIRRNEALEMAERQRVGKMVERVEKIKQRAAECGPRYCRLCGQSFGLLGPSKLICDDCRKPVCSKCSIELHEKRTTHNDREVWLCKICSETREMWKKSGAWFFKGLPRYELPQRNNNTKILQAEVKPRIVKTTKLGMQIEDSSSDEDEDENVDKNDMMMIQRNGDERNITSLRLGNGSSSKLFLNDDNTYGNNKKSPISPHSRQTSSSDSQQSSHGIQTYDWDTGSISGCNNRRESSQTSSLIRRSSMSSSWSISESSSGIGSSNAGVNQVCKEPPLGWLELVLNFDDSNHTLDCSVIRARDLPPMDSSGLADPFCKLNIVAAEGVTRQQRWLRTKTVHKTRNPEFNETVTFLGIEPEELGNAILYAVLLDEDKYGHDFLGSAKILLSPIYNASPCRISVPLGAEDQYSIEAGSSGPWPRGQILVSLCYNTKRRALVVLIKRCINLVSMDSNGFSDPFIKVQLKPDSHRKKYKTSVKWRNLNPVFNEEFSFETRPNDLDKQSLIFTVWDKDIGKSNDFLGSLILGPNSKGRRLKQWKDCVRLPDHFHEQWHCLSSDPSH